MSASSRFDGKVVLVTGSSRGIGAAIAQAFAQEGALVLVNYLRDSDAADHVVAQCRQAGGDAWALQADVRAADEVKVSTMIFTPHQGVPVFVIAAWYGECLCQNQNRPL